MGLDLASLPRANLEAMLTAGKEARECRRVLARTGDNLVGELLRGAGPITEWTHYPAADVCDPITHALYYYHCHPAQAGRREHGHFHTFLRASGMPPGVHPAPVPDLARSEIAGEAMSHLVAIAMDAFGAPIRLFTTNRWVTGEVWYAGPDVISMLDRFQIAQALPSWPVNRWIGAMLRLFRPQIESLIEGRDRAVAELQTIRANGNALEDRAVEVTSEIAIDMDRQIEAVRVALAKRRKPARAISSLP